MSIPRIILDTDPGGDDAIALFWLLSLVKQGVADLVAVTTTEGNVAARQTFTNASQILSLLGFAHIPVGRGVPLKHPIQNAAHIHGSDGMGNLSQSLPAAAHLFEIAPFADQVLIEQLTAFPGEITVVAVGPLTNLAAAEARQPGILSKAREVVVMAGGFQTAGNVTAQAEFNLWFHPTAAQVVLSSRRDIVLLPLDVTRHLILTRDGIQSVTRGDPQSDGARFLTGLSEFMIRTNLSYRETAGIPGFLVHDAVTLAYLFYPETLLLRRARVQVETAGEYTTGQTLMDHRHAAKSNANAWVGMQIDAAAFFACLLEDLKCLLRSP